MAGDDPVLCAVNTSQGMRPQVLQDTGDLASLGLKKPLLQKGEISLTPYTMSEANDDSDGEEGEGELPSPISERRTSAGGLLTEEDRARTCAEKLLRLCSAIFPWLLAWLIGVLTALTGSYIAVNCDYLGDLRNGICQGRAFSDRSRCCGGADNINFSEDSCFAPLSKSDPDLDMAVAWIPWESIFGADSPWSSATVSFIVYLVASLIFSGTAACLVHEYSPAARGSGIPEVKAAVSGYDLPKHFSGWCLLVKTVGLSLVVGAGLSLGKEGPLIHIGVCWAYVIRRLVAQPLALHGLPTDALPLHELACVGAAAGVSTAFGAPLGGVLFAAEELGSVRSLSRRALIFSFMSSFSASFTLKWLNLSGANKLTMFALSTPTDNANREWITWEVVPFLALGMVGGLIGAAFVKMNLWAARARRRRRRQGRLWMLPVRVQDKILSKLPGCCLLCFVKGPLPADSSMKGSLPLSPLALNVTEAVLIAFVTAILNFPITRLLRALSPEAIYALFETCPHSRGSHFGLCDHTTNHGFNVSMSMNLSLFAAASIRLVQTTYTFGAAIPSGLFIPSLFIGATIGRLVGNGMVLMSASLGIYGERSNVEPGVFAMVGAIATLSGFARMTVSLVVIMFELTGELTYIVPFMCAVLASKLVGDIFTPSIYDGHSVLNGYAPIEEPEDIRLEPLISDIAVSVDTLNINIPMTLETLQSFTSQVSQNNQCAESMLLVQPASNSAMLPKVIGLVERNRVRRWVSRQLQRAHPGTLCDFSSAVDREERAVAAQPPSTSSSHSGHTRFGNGVENQKDLTPSGVHLETNAGPEVHTLDAGHLVDTLFARLKSDALLLTAHCTFDQRPRMKFCICINDRCVPPQVTVLSRDAFAAALTEERFALSRPILQENNLADQEGGLSQLTTSIRQTLNSWSDPSARERVLQNPAVVGARDIEMRQDGPTLYAARHSSDHVEQPSETNFSATRHTFEQVSSQNSGPPSGRPQFGSDELRQSSEGET